MWCSPARLQRVGRTRPLPRCNAGLGPCHQSVRPTQSRQRRRRPLTTPSPGWVGRIGFAPALRPGSRRSRRQDKSDPSSRDGASRVVCSCTPRTKRLRVRLAPERLLGPTRPRSRPNRPPFGPRPRSPARAHLEPAASTLLASSFVSHPQASLPGHGVGARTLGARYDTGVQREPSGRHVRRRRRVIPPRCSGGSGHQREREHDAEDQRSLRRDAGDCAGAVGCGALDWMDGGHLGLGSGPPRGVDSRLRGVEVATMTVPLRRRARWPARDSSAVVCYRFTAGTTR